MAWCPWLCVSRECLKLLNSSDISRRNPLEPVALPVDLSARRFLSEKKKEKRKEKKKKKSAVASFNVMIRKPASCFLSLPADEVFSTASAKVPTVRCVLVFSMGHGGGEEESGV